MTDEDEWDEDSHPYPWRGEEWISFGWGTTTIKDQLGVSLGAAQRTLRELCGSGDVRAIREDMLGNLGEERPDDPELIRPSEWLKDQIDFENNPPEIVVLLNSDDLQYWLNQRPHRSTEPATKRTSKKRTWVQQAINTQWPNGIPEPLTNPQIEKAVGDWLTDYCKKHGILKPDISRDNILRVAGRK